MKFSIITPTSDREKHLCLMYETIKNQKVAENTWEWLICDSSLHPSSFFSKLKDPRVRYLYDMENLSIGEKRNVLIQQAQNLYIVHFDDDDYYAPTYLNRISQELENADFVKLTGFFCYFSQTKNFFFWDTTFAEDHCYELHPDSSGTVREVTLTTNKTKKDFIRKNMLGYGFSFSYKKTIAEQIKFKNTSMREDFFFLNQAFMNHWRIKLINDEQGLVLHMVHNINCSIAFPQYRLPYFLCQTFFPEIRKFLKKYPKLHYAS